MSDLHKILAHLVARVKDFQIRVWGQEKLQENAVFIQSRPATGQNVLNDPRSQMLILQIFMLGQTTLLIFWPDFQPNLNFLLQQ